MLNSASSKFIALCQSQINILTQRFGAAMVIVYLAEDLVESSASKLIPMVSYPETAIEQMTWIRERESKEGINKKLIGSSSLLPQSSNKLAKELKLTWLPESQIVIPMIYEGVVMGFLVTSRADRLWNEDEQSLIDEIANTIAIAIFLDQRSQWLETQLVKQENIKHQEHDFIDDILHQLRNPLTAIRTFGKLLLKRLLPEDKNYNIANNIIRETDRLQELLTKLEKDIPEYSIPILEDQQPTRVLTTSSLILDNFVITEVLVDLLESTKIIAQEKNISLVMNIPDQLPLIKGNRSALREVFSNILDNAIKYMPYGGEILVEVGKLTHPDNYNLQSITITDTGSGIPNTDLDHIFERHYRGVQAETNIPGTGLGLAIALDLIKAMSGKIEVMSPGLSSQGDRPGTTFIVWLEQVN